MAYGSVLTDVVQSSTASTPPQFNDGNGTQIGTLCRAWVNFNGTGTVAIRASFNVSSITDNGTGKYTVNFTNAFPDTNYVMAGTASYDNTASYGGRTVNTGALSTSSCGVSVAYATNTFEDTSYVYVAVFR